MPDQRAETQQHRHQRHHQTRLLRTGPVHPGRASASKHNLVTGAALGAVRRSPHDLDGVAAPQRHLRVVVNLARVVQRHGAGGGLHHEQARLATQVDDGSLRVGVRHRRGSGDHACGGGGLNSVTVWRPQWSVRNCASLSNWIGSPAVEGVFPGVSRRDPIQLLTEGGAGQSGAVSSDRTGWWWPASRPRRRARPPTRPVERPRYTPAPRPRPGLPRAGVSSLPAELTGQPLTWTGTWAAVVSLGRPATRRCGLRRME